MASIVIRIHVEDEEADQRTYTRRVVDITIPVEMTETVQTLAPLIDNSLESTHRWLLKALQVLGHEDLPPGPDDLKH